MQRQLYSADIVMGAFVWSEDAFYWRALLQFFCTWYPFNLRHGKDTRR